MSIKISYNLFDFTHTIAKPLLITVFLHCFCYNSFLLSQTSFYIQSGGNVTKVENGDPSRLNITEWQVRLYKRGASTTGSSYWGTITGSTASEVMEKLRKEQAFELDFNKFIGKGRIEDDVYTHFNSLGPIALIDASKASELSLTDERKKLADLYAKAVDIFYDGKDINNNLKSILPETEENRYGDIGSNFTDYAFNLKDAVLQIIILRNLLFNQTTTSLQNINKRISEIDTKLNDARVKQKKVLSAIDNIKRENAPESRKGFYVFLTTTLKKKPEESQFSNLQSPTTLYIISKPFLHQGNLTDEMANEKEQVLMEIRNHFIDKPEILKELSNIKLDIHYGKPYSTEVLKTGNDCNKAIEEYKNFIKETLQGLTPFDFLEL
jgi:hypothetical protein